MKKTISIIIVDDSCIIRKSLRDILEINEALSVIKLCENGYEAIEAAQQYQPDIILMDIEMAPINGFKTTSEIKLLVPQIKIIAYSSHNEPAYARRFLQTGGDGYITKSTSVKELVTGILQVLEGIQFVCEEVKTQMNTIDFF